MGVRDGSRWARGTEMRVTDPAGNLARPAWLDALPRLREVNFADNQAIVVEAGETWLSIGLTRLGDARSWWAVAEFSGVLDPFAEIPPGTILQAPSRARLHLTVVEGE